MEGKLMKCRTKWYTSNIQGPSLPHSDTVVVFLSLFSSFTLQKEKSKINVCIKMDITADRLINTNIQKKKKKKKNLVAFQPNYKDGPAFLS
jgi:hypothetical protein